MSKQAFKPALPPGTHGATPTRRLSIDGWRVTYYVPTHGTQSDVVTSHSELAKMRKWLDEGRYSYKVREVRST